MTNPLLILACFLFLPFLNYSQVIKDLDGDAIVDTVRLDETNKTIKCMLSTKAFATMESKPLKTDEIPTLYETKDGFECSTHFMRAGFSHQFQFDKSMQKIRLVGMSRYEMGPASNDGSGKSGINLLTNEYVGEWNHYNLRKEKLQKMPVIRTKMVFPAIYLENYDGSCQSEYEEQCSKLYYEYKQKMK